LWICLPHNTLPGNCGRMNDRILTDAGWTALRCWEHEKNCTDVVLTMLLAGSAADRSEWPLLRRFYVVGSVPLLHPEAHGVLLFQLEYLRVRRSLMRWRFLPTAGAR